MLNHARTRRSQSAAGRHSGAANAASDQVQFAVARHQEAYCRQRRTGTAEHEGHGECGFFGLCVCGIV